MSRKIQLLLISITVLISTVALAQFSGGKYTLINHSIDGGGATSSGGKFSITGTIGQHDASPEISTGSHFNSDGGFWGRAIEFIFRDDFEAD